MINNLFKKVKKVTSLKPKIDNKVILIIRDGWGYRKSKDHNAILQTKTPNTDKIMEEHPNTLLLASNGAVGLPKGYQGNSEVGHLTIGSGRIINQSLERINTAIQNKEFFKNQQFSYAINNCKKNKTDLHLIGLLQTEGVHAHMDHLFALLDLCKKEQFKRVKIHLITDGRDAPVTESLKKVKLLEKKIKDIGFGEISTISGRFFAMDRDKRWDRTRQAYECIFDGITDIHYENPIKTIKASHDSKITDEFIVPRKNKDYHGINLSDSVIFYNYRTDRTRQLTKAIVEKGFKEFDRIYRKTHFVAMTQFYNPMNAKVAFNDISISHLLGEIVSHNRLNQLRISETEKYAHVTFFFNGQIEKPFKNEDRILIHSPKVKTYDMQPEMSAPEISKKLVTQINTEKYDFIVTNIVNGDMVGHTGKVPAIKKAVKAVDDAVGKIVTAGLKKGYTILIFADHGNCEDQSDKWRTSHTLNPVPFILASKNPKLKEIELRSNAGLEDIAPTVLDLMGIKKPIEMTGESIVQKLP